MVLITMLFILGLLIGSFARLPTIILYTISGVILLLAQATAPGERWLLFLLLMIPLGIIRIHSANTITETDLSSFFPCPDSGYLVRARIIALGETKRGTPRYTLAPELIDSRTFTRGSFYLYAKDMADILEIGDTLVGELQLQIPRGKRNPHDFDYRGFLRNQGIHLEAFPARADQLDIRHRSTIPFAARIEELKQIIRNRFLRHMSPRAAGILGALILGERGEIDVETRNDFANTGVIHVLAVSGLHVGYVILILMVMSSFARLGPRLSTLFAGMGLLCYVLLTGGAASVMRASLMGVLVILAGALERRSDVLNTLSTAAFIMLVMDPHQLWNLGFQLSFSAVLSIVTLYPVLSAVWQLLPIHMPLIAPKFMGTVRDLFLVSLAAQLGTLPLTVFYFHKIPIISLLANMLVVPLIGLIVAVGMAFLLLGWIAVFFAASWGALLDGLISFLLWFVHICSTPSWAYLTTPSIDLIQLMLLLAAIFAMTLRRLRRVTLQILVCGLFWCNHAVWTAVLDAQKLEVIVLDVGQGDAILLHTPLGRTLLIDAGLRFGGKDMGIDVILPYLRYRNWDQVDLMVLTHPHNDHIGGAQSIIQQLPVRRVIMPDIPYESYGYKTLMATLDSLDVSWEPLYSGALDSTLAPLYLRILAPGFLGGEPPHNVNNASIVLQAFYGDRSFLFTGDAEQEVEHYERLYGKLLCSDLIKVPHHGSNTSSTAPFLQAVGPRVSIISVGTKNKFGHPSPTTLSRYVGLGTILHRTDEEGAVIYHCDGQSLDLYHWWQD